MAAVRLPDGRELTVESGEKARDVAQKIGPRLARDAVVAKLNGELIDLDASIDGGGDFEVVTKDSPDGLYVLRHSTAHAMAQAILELYPGSKLAIGPPVENGFYYDIDVAGRITDADLPRIEVRMREIATRDLPIEREEVSKAEAEALYEDNPYKLEIICDLEDGDITIYRQGEFFDLCVGPHVPSTGCLGAFKLQSVAGAYWRGDENNPMLTRIYGTALRHRLADREGAQGIPPQARRGQGARPSQARQGSEALHLLSRHRGRHPDLFAEGRDAPSSHGELRARGPDPLRLRARLDGEPGQRATLRQERTPRTLQGCHVPADGGRRDALPPEADELSEPHDALQHRGALIPGSSLALRRVRNTLPLREERGAYGPYPCAGAYPGRRARVLHRRSGPGGVRSRFGNHPRGPRYLRLRGLQGASLLARPRCCQVHSRR